jgi:hypothetical protein
MIFRLDFKIYTKIKIKSTIKYQEENFKEISVASSFRRFSSAAEGKAKSGDNLLKKSRKKIFSFVFGKFVELTLINVIINV